MNQNSSRDKRGGVVDPLLLCSGLGLNGADAVGAQVFNAVADPLNVLLQRGDEVGGGARTARSLNREQVRKAGNRQAQIGQRTLAGPELAERHRVATPDINTAERTGHGIKSGGVDDDVQFVQLVLGADAGRRHRANRRLT